MRTTQQPASVSTFRRATPRLAAGSTDGFTLVEMMVTLLIVVLVVLGVLTLLDFSGRLARAQTHVAGMQQSQRVAQQELVRHLRTAGRGGFQAALVIDNDVAAERRILAGDASSPVVATASDVITVRGVFNGEILQLESGNAASFTFDGAGGGTIVVRSRSPSGVPQGLAALAELAEENGDTIPDALLAVSAVSDTRYVVLEMTNVDIGDDPLSPGQEVATIGYRVVDGTHSDDYAVLSSSTLDAPEMQTVAYVALLEEYRFYVRTTPAAAGVPGSAEDRVLSRARVYPGTEVAYRDDAQNLALPIAEGIVDLQVALGADVDGDGVIAEGEGDGRKDDEWAFNVAADNTPVPAASALVRLTTVARTDRPDPYFEAPALAAIEDRSYAADPLNTSLAERRYRRWALQTISELRNL